MKHRYDNITFTRDSANRLLSWLQHAYWHPLFPQAILTHKVSHTDLVFGVQSGFINTSLHASLQVSAASGYKLFHPGWDPHTQTTLWPAYINSSASWANDSVSVTPQCRQLIRVRCCITYIQSSISVVAATLDSDGVSVTLMLECVSYREEWLLNKGSTSEERLYAKLS